jgi:hypothetical protein
VTLNMPCGVIAAHALTTQGRIQQYTTPSQVYATECADEAFPTLPNGIASFVGCYKRCVGEDDDNIMIDSGEREAAMFVFLLPEGTVSTVINRRQVGEWVATQLTKHANQGPLPTERAIEYKYPKNFQYVSDDPKYGPAQRPLSHHFVNRDAVSLYANMFLDDGDHPIDLGELANSDEAVTDIFGDLTEQTRDLVRSGGSPPTNFDPGF